MNKTLLFIIVLSSLYFCACSVSVNLGIQTYRPVNQAGDTLTVFLGSQEEGLSNKLLVMIQGSGNESIRKRFGWGIEAAALGYDILYLEKYAFDDSVLFLKTNCRERRTDDIEFALKYVEENIYKNRIDEIFLFADSEGGALVPELVLRNPSIKRAVILASGGYEQSKQFELLLEKEQKENYTGFLSSNGIRSSGELHRQIDSIKNNPSKDEVWLGHTYYYWNSFLFYNPDSLLEKINIPILHIIGEKDKSVPAESVVYLKEKLKHKPNLLFKIVPDLDHSFTDSKGNKQLNKVLKEIILPWFNSTS